MLLDPPKRENGKSWAKVGTIFKRGGGVPLSQPKKKTKMVHFHQKFMKNENAQNSLKRKINIRIFFLTLRWTNFRGGGSVGWSKRPTFPIFFHEGSPKAGVKSTVHCSGALHPLHHATTSMLLFSNATDSNYPSLHYLIMVSPPREAPPGALRANIYSWI